MFGDPVGEIGRQQRQQDFDPRIMGPLPQPQAEPADGDAEYDLAEQDEAE